MSYKDNWLWLSAFGSERDQTQEQSYFATALLGMREMVRPLVERIARDMPGYTVHDITHLDAIWNTASLVASDEMRLSAPEAFVFGAAVLLHDAGMSLAAYPNGVQDVEALPLWHDLMALRGFSKETAPLHVSKEVTQEVIRKLHAAKARDLAVQSWKAADDGADVFLIADPSLRRFYAQTIGDIALSHWWSIGRVEAELDRYLGAFQPKTAQRVDTLKIACLLRVADALCLDQQRAPAFEQTLDRPHGVSALHWSAQGKLAFPHIEAEAISFVSTEAFQPSDSEAWWLAYDAIVTADSELRAADGLLREHRGYGFKALRIKGAGDATELSQSVKIVGWRPVDTKVRISDVRKIVEMLGGSHLYGNDAAAPIRELIQNAMDAVQARRRLENRDATWGSVLVSLIDRDNSVWLCVEDNGVGMGASTITNSLLDFGSSIWKSSNVLEEFPGLAAGGMRAIGQFGIGFFSVFMLGDEVKLTTRRYDRSKEDALTLHFRDGLKGRPLLLRGEAQSTPLDGGTRVEIRLAKDPREDGELQFATKHGGAEFSDTFDTLVDFVGHLAPASDFDIHVDEFGKRELAIGAFDWRTLSPIDLVHRSGTSYISKDYHEVAFLRDIVGPDGELQGRAAINSYRDAVVCANGIRVRTEKDLVGILIGNVTNAARSKAALSVDKLALAAWATEQARLYTMSSSENYTKAYVANVVLRYGGEIGDLPIVNWRGRWMNETQLRKTLEKARSPIKIINFDVGYDDDEDDIPKSQFEYHFRMSNSIMCVEDAGSEYFEDSELMEYVRGIIVDTWGDIEEGRYEREVGSAAGYAINRTVSEVSRVKTIGK